jgi:hypothetical protein
MCNGVCQSWNLPCNGTCSGFMSVKKRALVGGEVLSYMDRFWKCPSEDTCISSYELCNQADTEDLRYGGNLQCENNVQKSRLVCDNPDKFDLILNCTGRGSVQCPGNKTQQCIFGEDICNGNIDCIDRYSIL